MTAALVNVQKSSDSSGACRDFWMKITKSDGTALSIGTAATTVIWSAENPYYQDLVILEALLNITTEDDDDIDMDIGLADAAAGTNKGVEICDSAVNTAVGIFALLGPNALACTQARFVWLAKDSTTDSFITFYQTGASTHGVLKFTLLLRVVPKVDLT